MTSVTGGALALTTAGFFSTFGDSAGQALSIVCGLDSTTMSQVHQSLFNPDLVRASLAGDPDGDVKRASEAANLASVLESGPAPSVTLLPA